MTYCERLPDEFKSWLDFYDMILRNVPTAEGLIICYPKAPTIDILNTLLITPKQREKHYFEFELGFIKEKVFGELMDSRIEIKKVIEFRKILGGEQLLSNVILPWAELEEKILKTAKR